MDTGAIQVLASATPLTDVASCHAELVAIGVVRGSMDAREVAVMRRLEELADTDYSVVPESVIAEASKTSLMSATRLRSRADVCEAIPELNDALTAGATTGDRIDIVVRASVGLNSAEKFLLASHGERLAAAAGRQTATEFRKTVEHVVRQVRADDGSTLLEQQVRMARLRWYTDGDGMWCLNGRFDPATGARLEGRLRQAVDSERAKGLPDTCPTDLIEKQQHLAAIAFAKVALGAAATPSAVPDVTVLIDAETFISGRAHEGTILDAGIARSGLPIETVRRWACVGTVSPVVVAADGVRIMLGRSSRLANLPQRRALRALYRSCAMCDAPFDDCEIHHVDGYAIDNGFTDIDRLIPACNSHHHFAHEGGWKLHLAPDRTLTVTKPGGVVMTIGPPRVLAA